jgi:hypothetical protein
MTNGNPKSFIPKLKRHLLPRILYQLAPELYPNPNALRQSVEGAQSQPVSGQWSAVTLDNDRLFTHQVMRAKYTTYDIRRAEDIVNLRSEPNVMVLQEDCDPANGTPYRYARVLGIYHANVRLIAELKNGERDYTPHRVDFLWVRWYKSSGNPAPLSLEELQFEPLGSSASFGFLDPCQVLRAAHLTPRFSQGKLDEQRLSPWMSKTPLWKSYFVNR